MRIAMHAPHCGYARGRRGAPCPLPIDQGEYCGLTSGDATAAAPPCASAIATAGPSPAVALAWTPPSRGAYHQRPRQLPPDPPAPADGAAATVLSPLPRVACPEPDSPASA